MTPGAACSFADIKLEVHDDRLDSDQVLSMWHIDLAQDFAEDCPAVLLPIGGLPSTQTLPAAPWSGTHSQSTSIGCTPQPDSHGNH